MSTNNNLEDTTMQQCDHITILSIYTGSVSLITLPLIPVVEIGISQYLHRSVTVGVAAKAGAEHCGCRAAGTQITTSQSVPLFSHCF